MKPLLNHSFVKTIIVLSGMLGISVGLGFNCSRMKPGNFGNSSSESSLTDAPPLGVGFLTSEQMIKAMISATGTEGFGELTDPADDLIFQTYNDKTGMLPSLQNLYQATGPTLIATTNLASTVCAKAVDRDRAIGDARRSERLFFREMAFSTGLSGQNSDSVTLAFGRIARNAWRRDIDDTDLQAILTFAQEFSAGVSAADPAETRMLAIGVCTAALSSIDALTY
jgi:hypothetical protein